LDKIEFLNRINGKDELFLANIFEKINIVQRTGALIYTNEFCTPDVWKKIIEMQSTLGICISSNGVFKSSERQMLAFSSEPVYHFPIKLIKIENKSKFNKVSHRDYMGAIMSLGISRSKIGDFVACENECYVATSEDIFDYIMNNLTSIGRCPCKVSEYDTHMEEIPDIKFEELSVIVTSLRLDCLISEICNTSRSKALNLIGSGSVLVDYVVTREKNYPVKYGDTITLKGYGKYKISYTTGTTGRQRIKLLIKKFV
jgi:RNA-binding protein YlmH